MARKKKDKESAILDQIKQVSPIIVEQPKEDIVSSYVEPSEFKALKPGDWISLNIRNSTCFGLEQDGQKIVWLSRKNRSMQLPNNISQTTLTDLYKAILAGYIVKGNVHITKEDQNPDVLTDFNKLLSGPGNMDLPEQIKKVLKDTAKKQKISGISVVKIFNEMYKHESEGRKRPKVLQFLEDLANFSSKFHNVSYEPEVLGEETKVVFNSEELKTLQVSSIKEVMENTGLGLKKLKPDVVDFANAYKEI